MSRNKKKVLVIGVSGFIGRHLLRALKHSYDPISFSSRELDISRWESFKIIPNDIEIVFNLAAETSLENSPKAFLTLLNTNVFGTYNVCEWSRSNGVKKVIHSSSVSVCPNLKNPYALTKKMAEEVCLYFRNRYGLDIVILRYSSVYGRGQNPRSVLPIFVERARSQKDIVVFGEGKRVQDFVYVKDVVSANILAAEKETKAKEGIYNIFSGQKTSILELAQTIIKVFKSKSKITFRENLPEEDGISSDDISRAIQDLDYRPKYNLAAGLEDLRKELI